MLRMGFDRDSSSGEDGGVVVVFFRYNGEGVVVEQIRKCVSPVLCPRCQEKDER